MVKGQDGEHRNQSGLGQDGPGRQYAAGRSAGCASSLSALEFLKAVSFSEAVFAGRRDIPDTGILIIRIINVRTKTGLSD